MIHEGKIEVSFQIRFFWTIVTPKPKKLIIVPGACNISTLNGEQELSLLLNLGYISHEAFFRLYIFLSMKNMPPKNMTKKSVVNNDTQKSYYLALNHIREGLDNLFLCVLSTLAQL